MLVNTFSMATPGVRCSYASVDGLGQIQGDSKLKRAPTLRVSAANLCDWAVADTLPAATDIANTEDLIALPVAASAVVPVVNIQGERISSATALKSCCCRRFRYKHSDALAQRAW